MSSSLDDLLIVSCRSAEGFVKKTIDHFKSHLEDSQKDRVVSTVVDVKSFPDGEIRPMIPKNVRKKEVHIFQCFYNLKDGRPMEYMLCEEIKELELTINAAHFAGAEKIVVYLPYCPFMGEDKKDAGRVPQSAQLFFRQLESAGYGDIKRFTCMDLHAKQEVCFANVPVDNLRSSPSLVLRAVEEITEPYNTYFIISPDAGGAERAKRICEYLGMDLAIAFQTRTDAGKNVFYLAGKVKGRKGIAVDDMGRGIGSIETCRKTAMKKGAESVDLAILAHGVLCRGSDNKMGYDRIKDMGIRVIMTDSIPRSEEFLKNNPNIALVSVAPLFGGALYANFSGTSMTTFITNNEKICKQKILEIKEKYN